MMSLKFHGVTSISLVGVAAIIAAIAMFRSGIGLGIIYLILAGLSAAGILYAYCAKCPCRLCCGHLFPGRLAARLFPNRQPGPYTGLELAVLGVGLLLLIGLPQLWLWRYPGLLIAYWLLTVIGLVQIRLVVCRACENIHCPARPR